MNRVSIVVPTRDRPKDLAKLLATILTQTQLPLEVIVVDDSSTFSAKQVVDSFSSSFKSVGCKLKYVTGSDNGLSAARNLGKGISEGDSILFLDDDTLLDRNVISAIANFLRDNQDAMGVQPEILRMSESVGSFGLAKKCEDAVYKVLMLSYHKENTLQVRRSGMNVFPNSLTKTISAQRLSGCCCCYRRGILNKLSFDTNLKRCGIMEDLDFSYRVYRSNQKSLYAIPNAKIIHKVSKEARLPIKLHTYMSTIYWFYVFFKDIFEGSILNLIAFLWALTGNLACILGGLIIKRKPKTEWWNLTYLLGSYFCAFKNLREIKRRNLDFFNKQLGK